MVLDEGPAVESPFDSMSKSSFPFICDPVRTKTVKRFPMSQRTLLCGTGVVLVVVSESVNDELAEL
jgi:hypothetical protein